MVSGLYKVNNVGYSLNNFNITMNNVLLSYYNPSSTSFSVSFKYDGYNVSVKGSGVVVGIYCTDPCQRCSASVTAC